MQELSEFFLISLPGLEDLVAAELTEWFPELQPQSGHGGITVLAPLERGLAMNLALKTPTRVLLRVAHFRCRDFPKLYDRFGRIPWQHWISPSCKLEMHVSSKASRLKMKKRIEETCQEAWAAFQKKQKAKPNREQTVALYVRFLNDECTLSLDTSGERLHKRGLRTLIGEAPLRETIAAAMLQWVAGSDAREGDVELVDPMTGSGVFLLEAAVRDRLGTERDFAFANFVARPEPPAKPPEQRSRIVRLTGFEADAPTLAAARDNLAKAGADADLHHADFFSAAALPATKNRRWLLANPPYGERLSVPIPLKDYYEQLFEVAERVARPDRACVILPAKATGKLRLPSAWKVLQKRSFLNGGLAVTGFLFGRR